MRTRKTEIITFQDIHFTRSFYHRFISSLSEPMSKVVICSPYFDKIPKPFHNIFEFCLFLKRRGVEDIQIITRPPGVDRTAISLEVAKRLSSEDVEILIRTTPFLHAKMYHFEYVKGYFRTFIGSSNFTIGGFERNHELVAEMEGVGNQSPCHREIARLQIHNGSLTYHAWINHNLPKGDEERL